MAALNLSINHGTSLDEAKRHLRTAVEKVQSQFGSFVKQVTWSPDATSVHVDGPQVKVDLRVDAQQVHVTGDISGLGMLGNLIQPQIKSMLQQSFQKRLQ